MQGDPKKLDEAASLFEDEIGPFGGDDWRLRLGHGMTLQQLAHAKSLAKDAAEQAKAPELRQRARVELEAAGQGSAKDKTTPAELPFQLALLDLEDDRLDLFPAHAKAALASLKQNAAFLEKEKAQAADPHARSRVDYDLAVNRERGRRIAQEAAGVAWNAKDVKGAAEAMATLEAFGPLDRADFYNRAHMREEVGDLEGAEKDYDQFLKASAGRPDENVTRAIESLTKLRARLAEQRTKTQLATGR
jgi:hypothetical protein